MNLDRAVLRGLFYAFPGLLLSCCLDILFQKYSETLALGSRFGVMMSYGRLFGANPYLYYALGLNSGFLIFLVVRRFLCNPPAFVDYLWPVIFVLSGILVIAARDMLLGIAVFSFAPGLALFEAAKGNRRAAD